MNDEIDLTAAGADSLGIPPSPTPTAAGAGIQAPRLGRCFGDRGLAVGRVWQRGLRRTRDGRPIVELRLRIGTFRRWRGCLVRIRGAAGLRALRYRRGARVVAIGVWLRESPRTLRARTIALETA